MYIYFFKKNSLIVLLPSKYINKEDYARLPCSSIPACLESDGNVNHWLGTSWFELSRFHVGNWGVHDPGSRGVHTW
jgi:hypothetical protein